MSLFVDIHESIVTSGTIWKQSLKPVAYQIIDIPAGAVILSAREQGDDVCIWFLCDPSKPKEPRGIMISGTGHPVADDDGEWRYLGQAQQAGGALVWHLFEMVK